MPSPTPSNGDMNQMEMSRRSARLGTKDLPDDDAASTSSTGSTGQVSYRETPVRIFKRKSGGGRKPAGSSRTSSRGSSVSSETVNQSSEPIPTERYPSVSSSALRAPIVRSSSSSSSRHFQPEAPGFSSGYSSSEEAFYKPSLSTSVSPASSSLQSPAEPEFALKDALRSPGSLQSPAEPEFALKDALRSPAQSLVMVYWWLGSAWYRLTSGISYLDVFLLSRRTAGVRKAILLFLLFLLLAFGSWYCYPHLSRSLSQMSVRSRPPAQAQPTPVQPGVNDGISPGSLSTLKEEIYRQLREQEARWSEHTARDLESVKREISLLKQDEQKQLHATEMLQSDVQNLLDERVKMSSVHLEQHSSVGQEIAGVQQQITQLRTEVSDLRAASDSVQKRITSQEDSQIKAAALLREELTTWLLEKLSSERLPLSLPLPEDVVLQPHLQGALEALEQQLLKRLAEEKEREKTDAWRTVGETLQREGVGAITVQDVELIVHRALSLYRADGIGMADYALESSGASVVNTRCSETYRTRSACLSLFGFPLWYHSESPRTVIQPELYPGKCWAFRGAEGFLVLALSYPVRITHVTLEHLPKALSPTGRIDSAPRKFAVYGMSNEHEEGTLLGTFSYDQDGEPIQTFKLPAPVKEAYRMAELRILSNWGHTEYTCVYRFRVHGEAEEA
ncbi:SUN domain-containing protein 2-like isoform X1 [Clupea harengus]|uniref:SUN domain-containing protein 2-like isoform X1 n=1 Tax=Clupea harengus TaxID=7950 RepID=A0A6P8F916_CLUHA|nr:SUN domain-containing protein 2-like isoform X1 [Clupea harengus]XP_042559799.1 SUN domain-containing protein 2-like isoform X1 [Clupea harengus]XP_042559800.1 SUN domain-containing protein 2-like isoform X1 [Clupea harengus]